MLDRFEDDLLGIPAVLKSAVEQSSCETCGKVLSTRIPALGELIAAMALTRIKHPIKLSGKEIRFLRKALDLPAKELARWLEVTPETVSRWENDRELIGPTSEKLLRLAVGDRLADQAPAIDFNPGEIVEMRVQPPRPGEQRPLLTMERISLKRPREPRGPHWGEIEQAA